MSSIRSILVTGSNQGESFLPKIYTGRLAYIELDQGSECTLSTNLRRR
jgi:hypothetical protein